MGGFGTLTERRQAVVMRQATTSYARHRYPKSVIAHAVWLYH